MILRKKFFSRFTDQTFISQILQYICLFLSSIYLLCKIHVFAVYLLTYLQEEMYAGCIAINMNMRPQHSVSWIG